MVQHQRVWMQRRQKNWLKYTDFTDLKKITSKLLKLFELFFYFKSFKFRCSSFCFIKKCALNCKSVLLILLLTS